MTAPTAALQSASPGRPADIQAFLNAAGWGDAALHPLAGDASFRRYIRLKRGAETAMLMDAPPDKEKVAPYVRVARCLHAHGHSAPRIYAEDAALGLVLAEDLGDDLFTKLLAQSGGEEPLYDAAVDALAAWHAEPGLRKATATVKLPDYTVREMMREVALFSDWFLPKALGAKAAEQLRDEYLALWENILARAALPCETFVHRDYHADNLLWLPRRGGSARVGLLDFQDALWGHAAYDLASLLEDARRDVSPRTVQRALKRYLAATGEPEAPFMAAYAVLAAQRNSKIVGIFVRLCERDGKPAYLKFLPRVWKYLEQDLQHPLLAELRAWMDKHVPADARHV